MQRVLLYRNYLMVLIRRNIFLWCILSAIFFAGFRAWGSTNTGERGDTTVWFVNIYPGSEIYELEGHSALRLQIGDEDIAVNYGLFSFETPNFVYRFVKGETDYMVGIMPWSIFESEYKLSGRRMVAHRLNLTSRQKERLLELLRVNLLPQNRVYRYNYVLDNCATRPLRAVELSTGDILEIPSTQDRLSSFRDYMRYYHVNYPWYQFGIDLALGSGIDRTITDRETTFAPVVLDSIFDEIKTREDGSYLSDETVVLNDVPADNVVLAPTPTCLHPLFLSIALCALICGWAIYRFLHGRKYPRVVASVMFFLYGCAGLILTFLIFVSVHEATSPNYNYLWLNPACFIPAVALWIKKAKKLNYWYFLINFVLLTILTVVWIIKIQSPNPAFIPLVLTDMVLSGIFIVIYRQSLEKI